MDFFSSPCTQTTLSNQTSQQQVGQKHRQRCLKHPSHIGEKRRASVPVSAWKERLCGLQFPLLAKSLLAPARLRGSPGEEGQGHTEVASDVLPGHRATVALAPHKSKGASSFLSCLAPVFACRWDTRYWNWTYSSCFSHVTVSSCSSFPALGQSSLWQPAAHRGPAAHGRPLALAAPSTNLLNSPHHCFC